MTFALGWDGGEILAGGLLYFDAVTTWNRSFTGSVTKHPIDGGGSITDHYVNNNPSFTLSAVISGTDISMASSALFTEIGDSPSNSRPAPSDVQVTSTDNTLLMKFIPNAIGQFLPDTLPTIVMDGMPKEDEGVDAGITEGLVVEQPPETNTRGYGTETIEGIQETLVAVQSGEGFNIITGQFETRINPVTLYETGINTLNLLKKLPPEGYALVITSVNFREDASSGYALYADITFEQVRFANLKKVTIPADLVQAPVKKKVATKKSLARCDSTPLPNTPTVEASRQNTVGIFPL